MVDLLTIGLPLHFRLGRLTAGLFSDDAEFRSRFERLFRDCLVTSAGQAGVFLEVRGGDPVSALIAPAAKLPPLSVFQAIVPELGLRELPAGGLALPGEDHAALQVRDNEVFLNRRLPWQILAAHYFVHHVLALQPELLALHAASLRIGAAGVLLSGSKGRGKSTLSLALASRGHGFLGDEIALIDPEGELLLPIPRAASIRPGPQAAAVRERLERGELEEQRLADGTLRYRAPVSQLLGVADGQPARLTHAFFLEPLAERPQARAFDFSQASLGLLGPILVTFASGAAGARVIEFLRLFARVRCYMLSPGGTPEETAEIIERTVGAP